MPLHVSSITCSSLGGATQATLLGVLRACYVNWLHQDCSAVHSNLGTKNWRNTHAICQVPLVKPLPRMSKICSKNAEKFLINWINNASRWFLYNDKLCRQLFWLGTWQNCERRLLAWSCLSVCPSAWCNLAPTGRIFIKFDIWWFFENLKKGVQIALKSDKNEEHVTLWTIYVFYRVSLFSF
jgi:hypothetical protein